MIPVDVVDYARSQIQVLSSLPNQTVLSSTRCLFESPWERQVLPVYTDLIWFGEFTLEYRLQVLVGPRAALLRR